MTSTPVPATGEAKSAEPNPGSPQHARLRSDGGWWATAQRSTEQQLLVGLVPLSSMLVLLYPHTLDTTQNVRSMSTIVGILLVVAIGQSRTLVVGCGVDPSMAVNMGFVCIAASPQLTDEHSILRAVLISLLATAGVGFVNRVLVAGLRITLLVVALGVLAFLGGYAGQLSGGQSLAGLPPGFARFARGDRGSLPFAVGIAGGVLLLAWLAALAHSDESLGVRRSARPHRPSRRPPARPAFAPPACRSSRSRPRNRHRHRRQVRGVSAPPRARRCGWGGRSGDVGVRGAGLLGLPAPRPP